MKSRFRALVSAFVLITLSQAMITTDPAQRTQKPVLYGRHWVAVTGKPPAATAGAMIFAKGGNAVDAACAMIAATSTMWDTLSWGGETWRSLNRIPARSSASMPRRADQSDLCLL